MSLQLCSISAHHRVHLSFFLLIYSLSYCLQRKSAPLFVSLKLISSFCLSTFNPSFYFRPNHFFFHCALLSCFSAPLLIFLSIFLFVCPVFLKACHIYHGYATVSRSLYTYSICFFVLQSLFFVFFFSLFV